MLRSSRAFLNPTRWAAALVLSAVSAPPLVADPIQSDGLMTMLIHTICGDPTTEIGGTCRCGNFLGYDPGAAAPTELICEDRPVLNYAGMDDEGASRFLVTVLYGHVIRSRGFPRDDSGDVTDFDEILSSSAPYFAGHTLGALVGADKCKQALVEKNASLWGMGTALANVQAAVQPDLAPTPEAQAAFEAGCVRDAHDVWKWLTEGAD